MDFNRDLTEFPSMVHRIIYSCARQLTPLERSLAGMEDEALNASCVAFHVFMLELLSDLYENTGAYSLPATELEKFLGGKKLNGVKQKQPAKTEKLWSQTVNAVNGYQLLLCMLGRDGQVRGNTLAVTPGTLEAIAKRTGSTTSPIPLDVRLQALARVGLVQQDGVFVCSRHPDMFAGMQALAASSEKLSSFGYFAFQNLEFRNIGAKYSPSYEDYVHPLIAQRRAIADDIDALARQLKAKPACNTFWKVDYKYNGVQTLCLGTERGELDVRITETYGWDDPALINGRLEQESPEFQRYILRHIWGCTGCSTSHLGGFTTILGHKRRVCIGGGIGFRWKNPGREDLESIEKCLEFRCRIIDELKKK